MTDIINEQSANYISAWDGLSMHQRLFLKAIIKSPERSIFSNDVRVDRLQLLDGFLAAHAAAERQIKADRIKRILRVQGRRITCDRLRPVFGEFNLAAQTLNFTLKLFKVCADNIINHFIIIDYKGNYVWTYPAVSVPTNYLSHPFNNRPN